MFIWEWPVNISSMPPTCFGPFCVIIEDHKLIANRSYKVQCCIQRKVSRSNISFDVCETTCYGPNIGNWMINYEKKRTKPSNYVWIVVVYIYMFSCTLYMLTSVCFALLNAKLILRYMQRIFLPLCYCHPLIVVQEGTKPAEEGGRRFRVAAE
jgi:hypothetical protein